MGKFVGLGQPYKSRDTDNSPQNERSFELELYQHDINKGVLKNIYVAFFRQPTH